MQDHGKLQATIVVPAYNAEPFIAQALASALSQTESHCEVLVIDDASSDATPTIVAQIAEQGGRVRLLRNIANLGPAASRNRGIAEARGEWIALLDADDEFIPRRIETLISLGEQHDADLVADNLLLCPQDTPGQSEPMLSLDVLSNTRWLSAAEFVAGNVGSRQPPRVNYGFLQPLMRRSFLEAHGLRYNEQNRFGEDFILYLACLLKGARWLITPEAMYRYRIRWGSQTDVQSAGDLLRIRLLEDQLLRNDPMVLSDPKLARAVHRHKAKIEHFYYYRAFTDAVKVGATRQALRLLLESVSGFRYIVVESLRQAPTVTVKALRGGYRDARITSSALVSQSTQVKVPGRRDNGTEPT
jgi:succinoglycan biosynthesis protein ExoO/succinoglycan biosynthesis protein ExoU